MSTYNPLLTSEELEQLAEIVRLLNEAYEHYFEFGDGYAKSSEAHISLDFGTYWDRADPETRHAPKVSIYSYVLGPYRNHNFDPIEQALQVVRVWHDRGMTYDYADDAFGAPHNTGDDPYLEIERRRQAEFEAFFREMDELMTEEGTND